MLPGDLGRRVVFLHSKSILPSFPQETERQTLSKPLIDLPGWYLFDSGDNDPYEYCRLTVSSRVQRSAVLGS